MIITPEYLLHNLMLFGRVLRGVGFDVNPGRMIDLAEALKHIQIRRKLDFYHSLRCLLAHSREEIFMFDQVFDLFWRNNQDRSKFGQRSQRDESGMDGQLVESQLSNQERERIVDSHDSFDKTGPRTRIAQTYSASEQLRLKDFSDLSEEEIQEILKMISRLTLQLGKRRTSRYKSGNGDRIDMRRTLRMNLRYGEQVLKLAYRRPKYKPRPLVIIADISGSMERYTRLLLHFTYGLAVGLHQQVETFVFGTRLTRVTRHMKGRSVERALYEVSQNVEDWSGGTRIGEVLKEFNFVWGRRVLRRGAVVILISDGWDRGTPDLLRTEMARLQRNCFRLVWLNPLLGSPGYEPLTIGMKTALPFVDEFLPVHNLASLEDLLGQLGRVGVCRPVRKNGLVSA